MSSFPIVLSLWHAPFIPSPFSLLSTSPTYSSFFLNDRATQQHQHWSLDECEHLYEESPWCLYALMLQDDLLQDGNLVMEEDREKIATYTRWGNRDQATKLRRVRCRMRMPCTDSLFSFFLPLIALRQHQNQPRPFDHRRKIYL
ncbi:hypothetical protein V8E52_006836 [Russula decolorans]